MKKQCCKRRSVVYEIWCMECQDVEYGKIDEDEELDDDQKTSKKGELALFKYIGESSRSAYERAWEHKLGLKYINPDSYMLKHGVDIHEGSELDHTRYGMKILSYTKSAFERQIQESVYLQEKGSTTS